MPNIKVQDPRTDTCEGFRLKSAELIGEFAYLEGWREHFQIAQNERSKYQDW